MDLGGLTHVAVAACGQDGREYTLLLKMKGGESGLRAVGKRFLDILDINFLSVPLMPIFTQYVLTRPDFIFTFIFVLDWAAISIHQWLAAGSGLEPGMTRFLREGKGCAGHTHTHPPRSDS